MTYYVPDDDCVRTIPFGRVGENDYTTIAFDISSWQQNYTIDTVVLLIQRHGDTEAYPVLVDIQDNYAVHTLNATDMAKLGNGKCQLRMRSGDVIGKSRVYNTICLVSLDPGEDPPPAPVPGWLDHMEDLVAEAEDYAEDASQAATDAVEEKFADLTVEAEGLSPGSAPTVNYDDEANKITFGIPNAGDVPTKTSDLTNDGEDGTSSYVEAKDVEPVVMLLENKNSYYALIYEDGTPVKSADIASLINSGRKINIFNRTDITLGRQLYYIAYHRKKIGIPSFRELTIYTIFCHAAETAYLYVYLLGDSGLGFTGDVSTFYPLTADEFYKLGNIEDGAQVNTIDTIKVNGTALTPDADKAVDISVPAAQVNSDWNAASGVAQILNKPSLATVATSGSYNDLLNKPTIPTVNDATLTIQKNGTNVATFSANASSNATANISVPTKPTDLITVENKANTDTTLTLAEGKFYIFPEMSSLTITCAATGMYQFRFTSGATATTFSMTGITMPDDFQVEANKTYEISVYEGYGVYAEWSVTP